MKYSVVYSALLLAAAVTIPATSAGAQDVLYRETFQFCSGVTSQEAGVAANWKALTSTTTLGKPGWLKLFGPGSTAQPTNINSNPVGDQTGFAFWSRAVYDLTIFTDEFSFDVSLLDRVRYEQRLSGVSIDGPNESHLALLIGNNWYISDFGFAQTINNWDPVVFDAAGLTYGIMPDNSPRGPVLPNNSGNFLPSTGTVRAFGIYIPEVNGRVRIDNFTIFGVAGSPIYQPQQPNVGVCPVMPTPAPGQPTPTPTTVGDDDSGPVVVETAIPEGTRPPAVTATPTRTATPVANATPTRTPAPTPTVAATAIVNETYTFCPSKQEGAGAKFVFTKNARKALLKRKAGKVLTPAELRTQALLAVVSGRSSPIGSVVNVTVGDYRSDLRTLGLKGSGKKKGIVTVRVNAAMMKYLDEYLAIARGGAKASSPLFVKNVKGSTSLSTTDAMCLSDIGKLIKREARRLKVTAQVRVVTAKK